MFENYLLCSNKNLKPNVRLYVQVKNTSIYFVFFELSYKLGGREIEKPSPIIPPSKTQRLYFPEGATDTFITVYNCYHHPPTVITHKSVSNTVPTCFKVSGTEYRYIQCLKVRC